MADDEGTAPRRPRRRAVRPAGPIAGETTSKDTVEVPATAQDSPVDTPDLKKEEPTPSLVKADAEQKPTEPTKEEALLEEEKPEQDVDVSHRKTNRLDLVLTSLFVVVVLALLAGGVYLFLANRATSAEDAQAERFVQTARQTVLNLTTIHPDSAQEDVDRLLAGASGDFKAEFEGREGPFVDVVKQARVDSNGEIIEAGIENSSDDTADVLVAARAMVKNSDAEEPQPRDFRLRVTVADDGDVMTASRVEFVP
ncbi:MULTISPECIES: hypothetical protein [unclassified Rhodococcus (in: high G+C Gram-positive bacteria)]|uniref:hypothetical protein n=1 Tax=unclassified Rhodococcus (in: high G+C Gram-positive bacteria) TaxID=192944 RepID=UPI0033933D74